MKNKFIFILGAVAVFVLALPWPAVKYECPIIQNSVLENVTDIDENENVNIFAVGDIMLGRFVRTLSDRANDPMYPFLKFLDAKNELFLNADIVFGNLEGPIYKDGFRSSTSLVFGFPESSTNVLAKVGFDVLSVANNHTLNQRNEGFESTLKLLKEKNISPCGNPSDEKIEDIVYLDVHEQKIAFVCFDDVQHKLNLEKATTVTSEASQNADFVVASVHFGAEYQHKQNKRQIEIAHKIVDAGADIVLGHHPHVVEPFEAYNGSVIFYSLGNFVFDQYWSYDTQEELAVSVEMNDEKFIIHLFPLRSERSQSIFLSNDDLNKFYDRFISWGKYSNDLSVQIRSGTVEISR